MELFKGKINIKRLLVSIVIVAVLEFVSFYFYLPAMNIFNFDFWTFQGFFVILFGAINVEFGDITKIRYSIVTVACLGIVIVSVVVVLIGGIASLTIFNASNYASLITIKEKNFTEDMPMSTAVNDIALMDTDSAKVVGQRAIGSLSDVVSQYKISDSYSTIDFNGEPMKVAPLEYEDFFKWINNRGDGIPGYVMVDPVNFEAKYVKLNNTIKFSTSAYFNDNLERHLRFSYPTAIFDGYYFEIDNEGNPYYVCPVMAPQVGMFGAYDVEGVVLCDPCSGETEYYDVADVPNWVDRVYDGALVTRKFNWYGELSGGFFNSFIGQEGCRKATDDYGYKVMDGDVWVYTGVTSVTDDSSNVGFVLINSRTCESIYYTVAGAEEHSAMSAAEGQVQNLGYKASFPSLINIDGTPTYLMVLKDKSDLVKMYAMVNVEKYSIVATGTNQKTTLDSYRKMIKKNNVGSDSSENTDNIKKQITVASIEYINVDQETYAYITDIDGNVYKQLFADNEELILIKNKDIISVEYEPGDGPIYNLVKYDMVTKSKDDAKAEEIDKEQENAD